MLHDPLLGPDRQTSSDERRRSARAPVQAELVVLWHHDPGTPVRYPVLDIGDGGARIRSTTPLRKGMSGTAVKLLPRGEQIHRMCTVLWSRPPQADGSFEIGLRFA
ncbi:MAG: PilZ domain-containing protein [Planctomycetota bacterium]